MSEAVVIVRTGIANLASVLAGLCRAGAQPQVSEDPQVIKSASRIVLPGVGAFGAGMAQLAKNGLLEILQQRIIDGRPTLAVCLGLQLLFAGSEETPGVEGLKVFDSEIKRFTGNIRVPQLGWNKVVPVPGCRFLSPGYAYFANSYRAGTLPTGWYGAYANHGGEFVAAIERGNVLCCQFHPELSGTWGLELLQRWIAGSESA